MENCDMFVMLMRMVMICLKRNGSDMNNNILILIIHINMNDGDICHNDYMNDGDMFNQSNMKTVEEMVGFKTASAVWKRSHYQFTQDMSRNTDSGSLKATWMYPSSTKF